MFDVSDQSNQNQCMSLVAELSEIKKEIIALEKFSAELRGYL